jgi:serine/threonine protein phosphatase PrpC
LHIRDGIELGSLTDIGCQRTNNEDQFSYWEPSSDAEFSRKGRLLLVADGMGGHEGGQEASRIAVEAVQAVYETGLESSPQTLLVAGIRAAHHLIQQHGKTNPSLRGMGTTCTAVALVGKQLYYAHVGDSRLYLLRGSGISQLTHDHSYVGRLIDSGMISPEEAESHPQRHILTAALGAGPDIAPDVPEQPVSLQTDDGLLLCTDGLWSLVSDRELQNTTSAHRASEACHELVQLAKSRGGADNITLQILKLR